MNFAAAVATTSAGPTIPLVGVRPKSPTQFKGPDPEITLQSLQHDCKQTSSPIAQTITPTNKFKALATTDEASIDYDDYQSSLSRKRRMSPPPRESVHKGRRTSNQRSTSQSRNKTDHSRSPRDRRPRSLSHGSGGDRQQSSSHGSSLDHSSARRDGNLSSSRGEIGKPFGVAEDPGSQQPQKSLPNPETIKENPKNKSPRNKTKNPTDKEKSPKDKKNKGKHGRNGK